jgi:diaminohydroxyphosphoribosylaminopyrimidine deaminase/5-amino-6-(5-phosphoribosylamino)uracil reductase
MHLGRDVEYMRRALALAERGWGHTAPNPMVGAVVVHENVIVGEGAHERFGEAHAEVNALREAGPRARGATVYVTLEPCHHHGKTPPCAQALLDAGVARVVVATRDPNPVAAGGIEYLRAAGVCVDVHVCEEDARELNAPFFFATVADRPWVTLKLALSIDGAIADAARTPGWLSNEASRAEVQRLRANSDAIAVGATTAIVDRPKLTARTDPPPRIPPLRVVFDRSGKFTENRTIVQQDDLPPYLVLDNPDLETALKTLKIQGVRSLLVEGGAGIASALLDADLVDRLIIFQAPVILGGDAIPAFGTARSSTVVSARRLQVLRRAAFGDDLMTIYALHAV